LLDRLAQAGDLFILWTIVAITSPAIKDKIRHERCMNIEYEYYRFLADQAQSKLFSRKKQGGFLKVLKLF
jgi:hypothetical protein